jgi:hypothetical protein
MMDEQDSSSLNRSKVMMDERDAYGTKSTGKN